MIRAYYLTISVIFTVLIFLTLIYYGVFLKHTKIHSFLRSALFHVIIKKILLALITLFIINTLVFIVTELMISKSFLNSIKNLLDYYYSILPFPKKICTSSYLENNELFCSSYKYKLIELNYSSMYMKNTPVYTIIKERTSVSFLVGIIAYSIQCLISIPLGIYIAKKENKFIDKTICCMNAIVSITPALLSCYLIIILFMSVFNLPVMFEISNLLTYIAPLTALTISSSLAITYFIRKYILIELNKDYVKFAKVKGLSDNVIFYKHVLKNAFVPFIRTIPSSILMCFCGFYILEIAFNIPGIGLTLISAIKLHDVYLIRGILFYFSILYIISYLIGDLITSIYTKNLDIKEVNNNE